MKEVEAKRAHYDALLDEVLSRPGIHELAEMNDWSQKEIEILLEKSAQQRPKYTQRVLAIDMAFDELGSNWIKMPTIKAEKRAFVMELEGYPTIVHCYSEKNVGFFEIMAQQMKAEKDRCLGWIGFINEVMQFNSGLDIMRSVLAGEDLFNQDKEYGLNVKDGCVRIANRTYSTLACNATLPVDYEVDHAPRAVKLARIRKALCKHDEAFYLDKLLHLSQATIKELLDKADVPNLHYYDIEELLEPTLIERRKEVIEEQLEEIEDI